MIGIQKAPESISITAMDPPTNNLF